MHPLLVAKLIILLSIANGTPVLLKKLFGDRFSQPIDGGLLFFDQRRLLGPSKTVRGALVSIVLTTLAAPLLGLEASTGALVASMAMVGDLFSSFIKRRLDFAPSSRVTGLDQIPESLFPLLACRGVLSLSGIDILTGAAVFSLGAILLSPVFHRIGIRDRPF
jgi:CDP-2,3-bis-(O-geranylgeranyl)-sn-glycerol synthase